MSTNILNHFTNGRVGGKLFARQAGFSGAPRHPSFLARLAAWRQQRAAARELSGLSDRDLADIGLTRQEIPEVVRSARR